MFQTKPLVLGANVFGWTADRTDSFQVLDKFLAGGGDLVDSADGYSHWHPGNSGGESETIIGEWIAARGPNTGLKIATKVSKHPEFLGLAPLNVRRACEASLKRLNVEKIDLYYAHYDDPSVPLIESAAAFSSLQDAGKIGAIGLSNFTAERVAEWIRVSKEEGLNLPVALQPQYNLMERDFETNGLREVALREALAVFPYYSLAHGFLTGKYRTANDAFSEGASPRAGVATKYLDDRGVNMLKELDEIALQKNTGVIAVALAWLKQQPAVMAPIASARNISQLAALLDSMHITLSPEELARLSSI